MLLLVLLVPVVPAAATAAFGWRRTVAWTHLASAVVLFALAIWLAVRVLAQTTVRFADGTLRADALAAFMVLLVAGIALLAIWSAIGYIDTELALGHTNPAGARLFGVLLPLFVATMLLALLAGNAAVTWVAIEGTTVATAFLVGHRRNRASLEASWKYVIIGSVGIALAFLGTIVLAYARRVRPVPAAPARSTGTRSPRSVRISTPRPLGSPEASCCSATAPRSGSPPCTRGCPTRTAKPPRPYPH